MPDWSRVPPSIVQLEVFWRVLETDFVNYSDRWLATSTALPLEPLNRPLWRCLRFRPTIEQRYATALRTVYNRAVGRRVCRVHIVYPWPSSKYLRSIGSTPGCCRRFPKTYLIQVEIVINTEYINTWMKYIRQFPIGRISSGPPLHKWTANRRELHLACQPWGSLFPGS